MAATGYLFFTFSIDGTRVMAVRIGITVSDIDAGSPTISLFILRGEKGSVPATVVRGRKAGHGTGVARYTTSRVGGTKAMGGGISS